jgi:hypothetical protein
MMLARVINIVFIGIAQPHPAALNNVDIFISMWTVCRHRHIIDLKICAITIHTSGRKFLLYFGMLQSSLLTSCSLEWILQRVVLLSLNLPTDLVLSSTTSHVTLCFFPWQRLEHAR